MNVINDNWLFVRYLNNEVKQISIRQAFIDADKIKNIETPVFHNTKVYMYDVPVIQLLSTILSATYFKPEVNFKAHNKYFSKDLMQNGWDLSLILNYLDKYQHKFNMFDDKYPFLQAIKLKPQKTTDETKESLGYISKTNLVAPSGNNLIFEHNSSTKSDLCSYKPTEDELVYILLYLRTMASSPMAAHYPNKALCGNTTMFMINYGKNLKETIAYNILPLRENTMEDDLFDRPIWEFDNEEDIKEYDMEKLYENTLLCTFFPCLPIYIDYSDGLKDIILSRTSSDVVIPKEQRDQLSLAYVMSNPWAIKKYNTEKDTWSYKEWNKSIKLVNLCIEITKTTTKGCGCNLIDTAYQENKNAKSVIYYREYDGMKTNVLSFGKYEIDQNIFESLQNEQYHEKAKQFQTLVDKILKRFNMFNESGINNSVIESTKLKFSKFAENYFFRTFCSNISNENIIENTTELFIKEAKTSVKSFQFITSNPLKYAQAYKKFCGIINKLKEENYA